MNRRKKLPSWSPELARAALSGHSILGLCLGALLYLVCLTGTLSVFGEDLRNWEAPFDERLDKLSAEQADVLLRRLVSDPASADLRNIILGFPTEYRSYGMLDFFEEDGTYRRAIGQNGNLSPPLRTPWTDFLTNLHADLHIPLIGAIVVGILGVFLLSSLLTGLIAHRKIFLEAFFVRRSGSPRLFQADIHNRLGAWALPFHLLIALTGAFLALTPALAPVALWYGYAEDIEEIAAVYNGRFPESVSAPGALPDIVPILDRMREVAPLTPVEYLTIHDPGSAHQTIDIETNVFPQLAYAEVHRFGAGGEYLGSRHYEDGPPGLQFFAASGSMHFGAFDLLFVRVVYGLLGLALTVCCVTGVNMWFRSAHAKGRPVGTADRLWRAVVWGVPIALGVTALFSSLDEARLPGLFYGTILVLTLSALLPLEMDFYDCLLRGLLAAVAAAMALAFTLPEETAALTIPNVVAGLILVSFSVVLALSIPSVRGKLARRQATSSPRRADGHG